MRENNRVASDIPLGLLVHEGLWGFCEIEPCVPDARAYIEGGPAQRLPILRTAFYTVAIDGGTALG